MVVTSGCNKPDSNDPTPPPSNQTLTITGIKPAGGNVPLVDTITGTNFSTNPSENSVYYNGLKVTVLSASTTQLIVSLPAQTTTGKVSLTINGISVDGPTFTVTSQPIITSISPTHGVASMTDTIFGINFNPISSQNVVYFNSVQASIITSTSSQIVVTVPQSTTGKVSVVSNGNTIMGPTFTFDNDSVVVTTFAGTGIQSSTDGPALSATFTQVWDVSSDSLGTVYVADGGGNVIRKIFNGTVTTIAGAGSIPASYGQGTEFNQPSGVTVDGNNNVYVGDTYSNRVRVITPSGGISTIAGGINFGHGWVDATGQGAYFWQPMGLVADKTGNIFVADQANHCIRKVTPSGVVTTLAGAGPASPGYRDGTGTNALFTTPRSITIDDNGNLYVADYGNNRIRKINPSGVVTTIAGKPNGGSNDGQGIAAGLGFPTGITIDKQGNLYLTQDSYRLVRKISPTGWVSTIAGTGELGSKDGAGFQATFSSLGGISIDRNGILYLADGKRVRKITIKR